MFTCVCWYCWSSGGWTREKNKRKWRHCARRWAGKIYEIDILKDRKRMRWTFANQKQNFKLTKSYIQARKAALAKSREQERKELSRWGGFALVFVFICFFIYNCICHWMYLYLYLYDSVFVFLYVFVFVLVYTHGQSLACEGGLLLYNYVLIFCKFV